MPGVLKGVWLVHSLLIKVQFAWVRLKTAFEGLIKELQQSVMITKTSQSELLEQLKIISCRIFFMFQPLYTFQKSLLSGTIRTLSLLYWLYFHNFCLDLTLLLLFSVIIIYITNICRLSYEIYTECVQSSIARWSLYKIYRIYSIRLARLFQSIHSHSNDLYNCLVKFLTWIANELLFYSYSCTHGSATFLT